MAENNSSSDFRNKAEKEIFDFIFWILKRVILWSKAMVRWVEKAVRAITGWFEASICAIVRCFESLTYDAFNETRPHILLILVAGLGAGFYLLQRTIPLPPADLSVVGAVALILVIVSGIGIIINAAEPSSNKIGITKPLTRLRSKIFKMLRIDTNTRYINIETKAKPEVRRLTKRKANKTITPKALTRGSNENEKKSADDNAESNAKDDVGK